MKRMLKAVRGDISRERRYPAARLGRAMGRTMPPSGKAQKSTVVKSGPSAGVKYLSK